MRSYNLNLCSNSNHKKNHAIAPLTQRSPNLSPKRPMNSDYQQVKNSSQKIHVQKFLSSAREYLPTDELEALQTGMSVNDNDYFEGLEKGKHDQCVGEQKVDPAYNCQMQQNKNLNGTFGANRIRVNQNSQESLQNKENFISKSSSNFPTTRFSQKQNGNTSSP